MDVNLQETPAVTWIVGDAVQGVGRCTKCKGSVGARGSVDPPPPLKRKMRQTPVSRMGRLDSAEPVFISGLLYSIRSWLRFPASLQLQPGAPAEHTHTPLLTQQRRAVTRSYTALTRCSGL